MELKISILFLIVSINTLLATNTYSQITELSLDMNNKKLEQVMDEIEKQCDFYFIFNQKQIDVDRVVSIQARNSKIDAILPELFKNTQVHYAILDNKILLTTEPVNKDLSANSLSSLSQQQIVTGKVTDAQTGELMIGVNILVKGTNLGVITDINGKYSLNISDRNAILVFSFIGYVSQEIPLNGRTNIDCVLEPEVTGLDEVVVIGYGTARRSDLVGSTAPVSVKEIRSVPSGRVDQVLQGRSPGIVIQNTDAAPNSQYTIRIRGSNSLSGSNDPLVVIDGFLGGDLKSVNPNDIASIEILKDASSTAIYGSRGSNGVILVTTKKGNSGKAVVEYNGFVSLAHIGRKMDLLNGAEYAETVNANRTDLGVKPPFTAQEIADLKINGGTDWQDVIYRQALQQNHQINISGGNDNLSAYLSGNYINNEGIVVNSSFEKYSVRANITTSLGKKFNGGLNVNTSKSADHPTVRSLDSAPTNIANIFSPTLPVYNPDGTYSQPSPYFGSPVYSNPLALALEPIFDNLSSNTDLNSFVEYKITNGLIARVLIGANYSDDEENTYINTVPQAGKGLETASITNRRSTTLQATYQLNYNKTISEIHQFNVTLVYEQQNRTSIGSTAGTKGFSSDIVTYHNLALGEAPSVPTSYHSKTAIESVLGRINYSFKQKYLISLTNRYDGASVFGANNKWGYFPSGAVAWIVSKEDFIKSISQINNLKLRASYGITGSQAVPPYRSLDQLSTNQSYPINGTTLSSGVGLGVLGNPDLKWEKTGQFNVGMDLGIFNNRVRITADYYNKRTKDLLMDVPLPRASGFSSKVENLGEVENKGFEFSLEGDPLVGIFSWSTNLNFSTNKNRIISLGGQDNVPIGTTGFPNFGNTIFLIVGQPLGVLKGYIQDGCWGTDEAEEAAKFGVIPGAPKYVDQNLDGKITGADITIMATTLPKFSYGWTNNFSYKNFDLNAFMQGVFGKKSYNLSRVRSERTSSDGDAVDRRILNRWTPDNQDTDVPSFIGSNKYEYLQSSRWIENGAYLRIKLITLGYNLNGSILNKIGISSARVYISAVNPFTFTKYTGFDPEADRANDTAGGIDYASYPSQKSYTVGLNVKF